MLEDNWISFEVINSVVLNRRESFPGVEVFEIPYKNEQRFIPA